MTLKQRDIQILHLEPTDVCQASCPACSRELDSKFDANKHHHLTVKQIQQSLSFDTLCNLKKMYMCGVYGDPAAGKHTLEIFKWVRDINPNVILGMHSNGSLQNTRWWQKLAYLLNGTKDYVVFSIDGLQDTNHIYRRGVDWTKLINNVKSFIDAGGKAHWDMLVYRHNEHQVDQCQQLAKDLGFSWFRVKVSSRPLVANLQTPVTWHRPNIQSQHIRCQAMMESSIYLDAQARIIPCCWLAGEAQRNDLNLDEIQQSWTTDSPHPICAKTCGTSYNVNNFTAQWQREIELCV
jgi:MoaA/NifB/PqqE/SkfB family radical SAM enzyme